LKKKKKKKTDCIFTGLYGLDLEFFVFTGGGCKHLIFGQEQFFVVKNVIEFDCKINQNFA